MNFYTSNFKFYLKFEKRLSINTIDSYIADLTKFFNYLTKNKIKLENINDDTITEYSNYLISNGINFRSINRYFSAIKIYIKFLIFDNILSKRLIDYRVFKSLKGSKKTHDILSILDIRRLLFSIDRRTDKGNRDYTIIHFLYSTGIRVSELINLKVLDIDFNKKFIKVVGKGGVQRIIILAGNARNHLYNYIKYTRNNILKNHTSPYVFITLYKYSKLSRKSIWNIVSKYGIKSGIKLRVYPHILRHSYAVHMLDNGADLRIIQELLGHQNITTTEVYTKRNFVNLKKTYDKFNPLN